MSIERALMAIAKSSGGYQIPNSLRFRSSASAYLSRTPSVAGNRRTWTYSIWHKRGKIGASYAYLMTAFNTTQDALDFNGDKLDFWLDDGASIRVASNAVYRDPSAWYHIIIAFDSTQTTSSDRIKLYMNGVQVTSLFTANYPSLNYQCNNINNTVQQQIGYSSTLDGYLADINFIDGQALGPTSFGAFDTITGVWTPKKYAGSYGTNGFHLDFMNGASTTTLGYDSSGNGNNWTTNNVSLTAGATYDWMLDSPTPFSGSSYGVGNYAVLNPLDKSSNITTSDGNLAISCSTASHNLTRATIALPSSGKFYAEMTFGNTMTGNPAAAFALIAAGAEVNTHPVASGNYCVYGSANTGLYSGGSTGATVTGMTTGQVWQFAVDVDGGNAWIGLNNSWYNVYTSGATTGNPSTGANPTFSGGSFAGMFFGADLVNTSAIINLGQRPFAYTPPTGFKSLCTQNLPAPTIKAGNKHFDATIFNGVNGGGTVVNSGAFQPDLVWMKCRNVARNHELADSVRGTPYGLFSNLTNAEVSDTRVASFNSNGFTVGANSNSAVSGDTEIAWQWKAGGAAVNNTAGSITSQVSANPTAGFSVVTYTGTGVNATVGHGLGIAPSFVIVKPRNGTTTYGWRCYHVSLGATKYILLNDAAQAGTFTDWNNTDPTSTVVSLGSGSPQTVVESGTNYVAYCFAAIPGYSAFGSYTGNGSADGPFVYCGFRPAFVLIKGSSFASNWFIEDQARNGYNVNDGVSLRPNLSSAEDGTTTYDLDLLSNGFKLRSSAADSNTSSATFIWAAFASNPFQYALAR